MKIETVTLPSYKRPVKAITVVVMWADVIEQLKATGSDVKSLSWWVLEKAKNYAEVTLDGESAATNFSLSVFENALDWAVGIEIVNTMKAFQAKGRRLLRFKVAIVKNPKAKAKSVHIMALYNGEWRSVWA